MHNTREEFLKEALNRKIICFGAGNFLKNVAGFLESECLDMAKLLDNSEEKWGIKMEEMEVQAPDVLKECDGNEYMILISSRNFADEIEKQIETLFPGQFLIFKWPLAFQVKEDFDEKLWYERIYKPCESLYKAIAENKEDAADYLERKAALLSDKEKVVLPRTALMITTRCTLCCKECANLISHYSAPKDYPADEIIQWVKNISNAVDDWICCELVGGEPFLYRELEKVLSYVLNEDKIQQVEFTTNASIIPQPAILELLRNDKVFVRISEYPGLINYERLTRVFDKYGIRYRVIKSMRWSKTGSLEKRNRSSEAIQSQYLNCPTGKICRTILNGKLHVCPKAASLIELGYVVYLEMVDLMDTDNLRENIRKFFQLLSSEACDYCDLASIDEELIEPAEQVRR